MRTETRKRDVDIDADMSEAAQFSLIVFVDQNKGKAEVS